MIDCLRILLTTGSRESKLTSSKCLLDLLFSKRKVFNYLKDTTIKITTTTATTALPSIVGMIERISVSACLFSVTLNFGLNEKQVV